MCQEECEPTMREVQHFRPFKFKPCPWHDKGGPFGLKPANHNDALPQKIQPQEWRNNKNIKT